MSAYFEQWIEKEYIRLILLADQLLGKEQLVDFYYGSFIPQRETAPIIIQDIVHKLDELLNTVKNHLDDTSPFYYKTNFHQQLTGFKTYLENEISEKQLDYPQAIETSLGVKLTEPKWEKYRQELKNSLEAAGYSGSAQNMLKEWQQEGLIDVVTFMDTAQAELPRLWEQTHNKLLSLLLTSEEIDFLQVSSQVKFCCLDTIWEDWPYYGGYRQDYMSMIALNARLQWNSFEVKAIMMHEAVPGRHLFWALRQRLHTLEQLPQSSMLSTFASPTRLVQEGITACTNEFIWPNGLANPKEQIALDHWRLRRAVGLTAAIKIFRDHKPLKEVQSFIQEQALLPPGRAKAMLKIIHDHPYHYPTAQLGYEFVSDLWQTAGENFCMELSQYRCPALLQKLYAPSNVQ